MRTVRVKNLGIWGIVAATIAILGYGAMKATAAADPSSAATVVDAAGKLRVPQDYRTTYQSLGSWAIAADEGRG